jgi:hypothetical protein
MDGWIGQEGHRSSEGRLRAWLAVAAVVAAVAGASSAPARGSAIRASSVRAQQVSARAAAVMNNDAYWRRALLQGWTTQVRVPGGMRLALQSNGLLPDTAFVTYLRWRQAINPQTFNARHPNVAQLLLQDQVARQTILTPRSPVVTTPVVVTPSVVNPPSVGPVVITNPPAVPEPSTVVVVGVTFAAAGWARSRRRRMQG